MRKSMPYGVLPLREEFDAAFAATCPVASVAIANERAFAFASDPRVGTCELICSELWRELEKAQAEWENNGETEAECDAAGQWCSGVLGVLGFEWV